MTYMEGREKRRGRGEGGYVRCRAAWATYRIVSLVVRPVKCTDPDWEILYLRYRGAMFEDQAGGPKSDRAVFPRQPGAEL